MRIMKWCDSKEDFAEGAGGGVARGICTGTIFSPDMKAEGSWVGMFSTSELLEGVGAGIVEFEVSVLFAIDSEALEGSSLSTNSASVGCTGSGIGCGTRAGASIS
jgi:hypothetical protein